MFRLSLCITISLLVGGCAGAVAGPAATGSEPGVIYTGAGTYRAPVGAERWGSESTIGAPVEQVWSVLPEVYRELGLEAEIVDANARILGSPSVRVRRSLGGAMLSSFLDCGSSAGTVNANNHQVTLAVLTRVDGAGAGSTLGTSVEASAQAMGTRGHPISCTSTGRLERRIAEGVAKRIGG